MILPVSWETVSPSIITAKTAQGEATTTSAADLTQAIAHQAAALRHLLLQRRFEPGASPVSPDLLDQLADLAGTGQGQQVTPPASQPATWLFGWYEILDALALRNTRTHRRRIKALNHRHAGPISEPSRGKQPKARLDLLRHWWEYLDASDQEMANHNTRTRRAG